MLKYAITFFAGFWLASTLANKCSMDDYGHPFYKKD